MEYRHPRFSKLHKQQRAYDTQKPKSISPTYFRGISLKPTQNEFARAEPEIDFQEAVSLYFNSNFKQFYGQNTIEAPVIASPCNGQFCKVPGITIPEDLAKLRVSFFASSQIISLGKNAFFSPVNDHTLKVIHPILCTCVSKLILKQSSFEYKIKKIVDALITQVSEHNLKKIYQPTQPNIDLTIGTQPKLKQFKNSGKMMAICSKCLIVYINIYCKIAKIS